MELSKTIKDMIKGWEGCRLQSYRCPSGKLTIGYGHTGADVKPRMFISQEDADYIFEKDISKFAAAVERHLQGCSLNNNQFDALVSLAYNIGTGALSRSTLLRKVKADPNDPTIADEFARFVRGGGVVLPGLVKRRKAEAEHYFKEL